MHRTFFSVVVFAALNLGVINGLCSRADEQAEAGNSQQSEKATPDEESVEQAKQQFADLDKDGDGGLTLEEYAAGTEGDAWAWKRWVLFSWDGNDDQRLDLKEFLAKGQGVQVSAGNDFRRRDGDGDGQLSREEFLARQAEQYHAELRRQFLVLDFDGSESLSENEFRSLPGKAPLDKRPAIPDPLADLRQQAFDQWRMLLAAADGDGDGALSKREWPAAKLAAAIPALAEVEFKAWDRDGDGRVNEADAGALLDLAYGFTRPDGKPLRVPGGGVLNWSFLQALDSDHDGFLSQEEFVPRFSPDKQKNAATFAKQDADGDTRLSNDEAEPLFWSDAVGSFLYIDKDRDGLLSHEDFVKTYAAPWVARIAERMAPAFDADGDGKLSLYEYRSTAFANPATTWNNRRADADNDGRLSWKEYYLETSPLMIGLNRHLFDRFDGDQDGFLSLSELEFTVDFMKAPPEIGFQAKDKDGDGKLTLAEVFAENKPTDGDQRALDRYEMRLAHAESRFLSDDEDGNGYLDMDELMQSQQSVMEAARRHSKVLAHRKTSLEGNYWVRKGVLVVNEIAFLVGVWLLMRRIRRSDEPDATSSTE